MTFSALCLLTLLFPLLIQCHIRDQMLLCYLLIKKAFCPVLWLISLDCALPCFLSSFFSSNFSIIISLHIHKLQKHFSVWLMARTGHQSAFFQIFESLGSVTLSLSVNLTSLLHKVVHPLQGHVGISS